jgi:phytoene dehydrogenase-like protein
VGTSQAGRVRDVVVVGGGHNGLACAAYLAKAGLDVVVAERRGVPGGAAVTAKLLGCPGLPEIPLARLTFE